MKTQCPGCQAVLVCSANALPCWCQALPSLPKPAYQDRSCLCATCLQAELMQGVVLFGIPNCDTVKKARAWLAAQGVEYTFWDFKKHGVPEALLLQWVEALGWQTVLNTRGTTWRGLPDAAKACAVDAPSAIALMLTQSSLIKRPVVNWGAAITTSKQAAVTVGFDTAAWEARLRQPD